MKKLITTLLILAASIFACKSQFCTEKYDPYREIQPIIYKHEKQGIPNSVKTIGIFTFAVVSEAVGDALYDEGKDLGDNKKIVWGKSLQAASLASLLAFPFITDIQKDKWYWYLASYGFIRAGGFDLIYNATRDLPIDHIGNCSLWDKALQQFDPPKGIQLFGRAVCLTAGFAIPINEFKKK